MNDIGAVILMIFSSLLAAVSQMMLKKSANKSYTGVWREYLNVLVIGGYAILFLTLVFNMIALRYLPLKVVTAIGTVSYVFVIILGRFSLREKIGVQKVVGMMLIIAGILIFALLG